jgi:hypothetical protein
LSGSEGGDFLYIPGTVKLRESPGKAGGLPIVIRKQDFKKGSSLNLTVSAMLNSDFIN